MDFKEAQDIAQTFQRLLDQNREKIDKGLAVREDLRQRAEAGEDVSQHYRFRWMDDSSKSVIRHLAELAKTFNDAHPEDRISVTDLMDVFARAIVLLKHASQQG